MTVAALEELKLREELEAGVPPARELEIREKLATPEQLSSVNQKDFGTRVEEKLDKRWDEVGKIMKDVETGKISGFRASVDLTGKAVAGPILDYIGEETVDVIKGISMTIPDSVKDTVKEGWDWFQNTDEGKFIIDKFTSALEFGEKGYKEFKKEFPEHARTLEALTNIGLVMAPAKVKQNAKPTIIGKQATKFNRSALKSQLANRKKFVQDLISPEQTKKVKIAETARTTEKGKGMFKRSVVEPSAREIDIADEVRRIKTVNPKNTIQGNLTEVRKHNELLARKLDGALSKSKAQITYKESAQGIDDAVKELIDTNPVIVGNAQTTATRVADKAKEIIASHPSTPSGMLAARKEFDNFIRKMRSSGEKVLSGDVDNALTVSVRTVRQKMNDMIHKAVPRESVKDQLRRQNLLYDAMDNMGPKAAMEGNHAIARAWNNATKVLKYKQAGVGELGLLFGLGYVSASEVFAPIISGLAGLGVVLYGGHRLAVSPNTRKGIAKLIEMTDRALLTSKNPSMIKQLRADRALMVEVMKNAETIEEEQNGN